MKPFITTMLFCLAITKSLFPQVTGIGIFDSQLIYYPNNIEKFTVIDSSKLVVLYKHLYPDEDLKKGHNLADDVMALQIGSSIDKFFSLNLHYMDRLKTYSEKPPVKIRRNYTNYEIITSKSDKKVTVINREPFEAEKAIEYDETLPSINWDIKEASDTLLGYKCQMASTTLYGRVWTVWFTTEIPINAGPWKLRGLPGIILKAMDQDQDYEFTAIEIKNTHEPICRYNGWQYKKVDKKEWQKFDRGIHEQPYAYCSKVGQISIFNVFTKKEMDNTWTIPYNPIEL